MSARVRWECPNGCGAVLAPSRPRADDVRRYCLTCSAKSGRLVRRSAPALERKRQARRESSAQARKRRAEKAREREAAAFTAPVGGTMIDFREEMERMFRDSQELRDRAREDGRDARWRPGLAIRRSPHKAHVSGHCDTWGDVVLTVGRGATTAEARETLMHELVHAVTCWSLPRSGRTRKYGGEPGRAWHGSTFRTALCRTARELFGCTVHPDDHREAYGLDRLIVEQMGAAGF